MINMEKVPETGTIYGTYTDRVVYEKYRKESISQEWLEEDRLLELHLFDQKQEYRLIRTEKHGLQEYLVNDNFPHDDVYEEEIFVSGNNVDKQENLREKVGIVNYIRYDENDLLRIVNYRLKEVAV